MEISDSTVEKLREFCRRHGITSMYLFGSYARNEATPSSDMDLLVELDDDLQLSYLDLLKLKEELEELTGTRVDLLEEKAIRNPLRRNGIIRERVLLYAS